MKRTRLLSSIKDSIGIRYKAVREANGIKWKTLTLKKGKRGEINEQRRLKKDT